MHLFGSQSTGEQWARAGLEGAPSILRTALIPVWTVIGVPNLGRGQPGSDGANASARVLGFELERSTDDYALLAVNSPLGFTAQLLFKPDSDGRTLFYASFFQLDSRPSRVIWATVAPLHRLVARYLLERATNPSRHVATAMASDRNVGVS